MTAELIYKTTSPAALAWWANVKAEEEAARLIRAEYISKQSALYGPTPDNRSNPDDRALMKSRHLILGLASGYNERPPEDSGWRLDAKDRFWKPKLATKEGKARAAELATLAGFDFRQHSEEIGVPAFAFAGLSLHSPGMELDEEAGVLYQVWGSGKCATECEKVQPLHPEVEWTEVPRSEWYAREEAKEKAAVTS